MPILTQWRCFISGSSKYFSWKKREENGDRKEGERKGGKEHTEEEKGQWDIGKTKTICTSREKIENVSKTSPLGRELHRGGGIRGEPCATF